MASKQRHTNRLMLWMFVGATMLLAIPAALGVAPAPDSRRDGSSLEAAQRISDMPGCGEDGSLQPATDACSMTIRMSGAGAVRWFTFAITQDTSLEMTITVMARTASGAIDMMLWYPGESPTSNQANQYSISAGYNMSASDAQNPPASDIDYVYLAGRNMVTPGVYTLLIAAKSGTPTVHLQLFTASAITRINDDELQALKAVLGTCCPNWDKTDGSNTPPPGAQPGWCGSMGRAMLHPSQDYETDPCHIPPNVCTTDGHLTQLILPATGLDCRGSLPEALASFKSLKYLELSYNMLNASVADVAKVASQMPALESVILRGTALRGPLSCDLVGDKARGMRKSIVLSNNPAISGPLDSCFTSSDALEELQLDGTGIEGTLPALREGAPLKYLYLGAAPGAGKLKGPIPSSYGSSSKLQHLYLQGHALSGPLPPLPGTLQLLDVSDNALTGTFPDLSNASALDYLDVSRNQLGGALPAAMDEFTPVLDYLDVSNNRLGGRLDDVRLPSTLVFADLSNNTIGGQLWSSTQGLGSLVELRLAGNSIAGPLKASMATAPALMRLDVSRNSLSGDLSAFAAAAAGASTNSLVAFNASRNQLAGAVPAGLSRLAVFDPLPVKGPDGAIQDRVFDLRGNRLVGAFPAFVAQAIPPMEAGCRCAYSIELPDDAPLACPIAVPSPMAQAANVLHSSAPSLSCEGRDAHGGAQRVPVWTLVTRGAAPAAGPASHPTPAYVPPTPPPAAAAASGSGSASRPAAAPAGGHRLSPLAKAAVAVGCIGGVAVLALAAVWASPIIAERLAARRQSRLTSALMSADGACEITVVPTRNAECHFQLTDVKGRTLDKEGVV